jgi:hypothetical protein
MFSLLKNLCKNLMRRASLWTARLIMPKPPFDFGMQTRSQAAKDFGLFEFSNLPQTPILLLLSTISMAPVASLRVHRYKVGSELRMALTTMILP